MDFETFGIGFWHPFGTHGRETPEQIIERKRGEVVANGWTFWSFQYRRPEVLAAWHRELSQAGGTAFVFCSNSAGAVDPADAGDPVPTVDCRSYRLVGQDAWQTWPTGVRVPHPFRGARREASAFMVARIVYPVERFTLPAVEWWSDGQWRQDPVPTRGEYLIRRGGVVPLRPVRAVLDLRPPFLALVRAEGAEPGAGPDRDGR